MVKTTIGVVMVTGSTPPDNCITVIKAYRWRKMRPGKVETTTTGRLNLSRHFFLALSMETMNVLTAPFGWVRKRQSMNKEKQVSWNEQMSNEWALELAAEWLNEWAIHLEEVSEQVGMSDGVSEAKWVSWSMSRLEWTSAWTSPWDNKETEDKWASEWAYEWANRNEGVSIIEFTQLFIPDISIVSL